MVERGRQQRRTVPDHDHPELMSAAAHDQRLHETFTLLDQAVTTEKVDEPVDYAVVETNDISITWPSTQSDILTATLTVPSWAGEALVTAYAQGVSQLNSGVWTQLQVKAVAAGVEGQLTADSQGRDGWNNWCSGTGIIATTVAAPGSTITVKVRGNVTTTDTANGWAQLVGTAAFKR